ncbi:PREDICTED: uncharacterized protein LOC107067661 [Polistes dominula]|uniref:Uncharacterized protein LOC107067661 n=1 Tax=Polistes dominula TaxID=743375 RepID=A0ABM1IF47_POLDO|nr:PREDICTED: uncharacterized protein LOC107067661 [Polistes dominula]
MPQTREKKCEIKQKNTIRKIPKSSTECVRTFRALQKALLNVQNNISNAGNNASTIRNSENDHHDSQLDIVNCDSSVSLLKNNAEQCRENLQKENISKVSKSSTERVVHFVHAERCLITIHILVTSFLQIENLLIV